MKIVLVAPTFFTEKEYLQSTPLGLAYLASMIRKDHSVKILIGSQYKKWEDYINKIKEINPNIVGFSMVSFLSETATEAIEKTKKALPNAKVIVGGPHTCAQPEEVIRIPEVDYVIRKEAEFIFPELLKAIETNNGFSRIDALSYKKDGKIYENPIEPIIYDIDNIPWPSRDLLPMDYFLKIMPVLPLPYPKLNVMTSRGCNYNCKFCQPTVRELFGKKNRTRKIKDVVDEIEYLIKKYKIKSIQFVDDEATNDKERTIELCNEMIRRGINKKIKWGCTSRINLADKEKYQKMKESGCVYISFGVESGSQEILNYYRKGITIEQTEKAFRICDEVGIIARANLMIGAPMETKETVQQTIDLVKRIKPLLISTSITTPLIGTDLYKEAKEKKWIEGLSAKDITRFNLYTMKRQNLTDKEVEQLIKKVVNTYKKNLVLMMLNPKNLIKKGYIFKLMTVYWYHLIKNPKQFYKALNYYVTYQKKEKKYTEKS